MSSKGVVNLAVNSAAGTTPWFYWRGGKGLLMATAAWAAGNAQLQIKGPSGVALNVGAPITADGIVAFELPPGEIRAVITTAGAVYLSAQYIGI